MPPDNTEKRERCLFRTLGNFRVRQYDDRIEFQRWIAPTDHPEMLAERLTCSYEEFATFVDRLGTVDRPKWRVSRR